MFRNPASILLEKTNGFHRAPNRGASLAVVSVIIALAGSGAYGQDTPDYFRQNCVNCHTIGGGRLTGPDLKNVSERNDAEWVSNFMMNPKQVVDGGDAYAQKLVE